MPTNSQTPQRVLRRRRRVAAAVFAALLSGSALLTTLGGNAPAQDAMAELESKMNELEHIQAQEGPLRDEIDRQNAQVNALIGQESALRQKEQAAQQKLEQTQGQLDRAEVQLQLQRDRLAAVRARLQRALERLSEMLVEIYKSGEPDTLSVVLSSASWSDVLSESEYLDRLQNFDDATIARVQQLRDEVTAAVEQLRGVRNQIRTARNQVAAQRDQLRAARQEVSAQHKQLVAARQARQATLQKLLEREQSLEKDIIPSSVPPGGKAVLLPNGDAVPPSDAPLAVKAMIEAANQINELPYVWGGGHGSFEASGYDCSGAVSFALHAGGVLSSPLDSTGFESWGLPGGGSWVTVYANSGHAWALIAGLRWDTAGNAGGSGPRWSTTVTDPGGLGSFIPRHPPGL